MLIELVSGVFDPWARLAAHERALRSGQHGACASFVGTLRDFHAGSSVRGLVLEHYPGMTERVLGEIAAEALAVHPVLDVLIVHRVGEIAPGEAIVLCAAWSEHRAAAFSACRALIEALKSRAPFWKKERLDDGERWVTHNTPG